MIIRENHNDVFFGKYSIFYRNGEVIGFVINGKVRTQKTYRCRTFNRVSNRTALRVQRLSWLSDDYEVFHIDNSREYYMWY